MAAFRSVTATALAAAPSAAAIATWAPSAIVMASANGPMMPLNRPAEPVWPVSASRSAEASAPRRNASCSVSTRARRAV